MWEKVQAMILVTFFIIWTVGWATTYIGLKAILFYMKATYYKININAECDRAGATTEQFCYNLSKTLTQANSPENVYCRSCVDKIEKYINCDMAITERTYITDKPGK